MNKLIVCMSLAGITGLSFCGCSSDGVDRGVVERGLAGGAGSDVDRDRIKAAGESAIPLIFQELRAHPGEMQLHMAFSTVWEMTGRGLVDPRAPYIRSVLHNTKELESIRGVAAAMLGTYQPCREIQDALMSCARRDRFIDIRVACLAALSTGIAYEGRRDHMWQVAKDVKELLSGSLFDKSEAIRQRACQSIGCIAVEAVRDGVELSWCRPLLLNAKKDSEYQVRKSAIDALLLLDQEKAKQKTLRRLD